MFRYRRSAFTLIEVIFVIVIIGILAYVAIPKLATTRDDAKAARAAQNLGTYIADIGAYYTSKGSFGDEASMSNVQLTQDGCFTGTVSGSTGWTISFGGSNSDTAGCIAAYSMASKADSIKTHIFGGSTTLY